MSLRPGRLIVASLGVFLVAFALAIGRPGQPPTLKADEPAYLLMAYSLAEDGDLRAERHDYRRLFEHFPYLPTDNLILMSHDGWQTVYFGKPFVFSLLAAPWVAAFGVNGIFALNMLLLLLMVWMAFDFLGQYNDELLSALFAIAFFALSPTFAYVFWIQPELFNMASGAAALYLALRAWRPGKLAGASATRLLRAAASSHAAPFYSGLALAPGLYNKPVLAAAAPAILWVLWRRRGPRAVISWLATAAAGLALLATLSVALTGRPTPYLGAQRSGIQVSDPEAVEATLAGLENRLALDSGTGNSWSWIFDPPPFHWRDFAEDLGYFFWGRHTGLLLYMPGAVLAVALFLAHARRSGWRWLLLASTLGVGLFFIVKIPINWHGGGGFVGNRYFLNVYPWFVFLLTRVTPASLLPAAAWGGAFLGPLLFTPFGAPVPKPGLQAHTRGVPYRYFPLELSIRQAVPGYSYLATPGATLVGRHDVFKLHQPERGTVWLQGAVPIEVVVLASEPIRGLVFEVQTWAEDNVVDLGVRGDRERLIFSGATTRNQQRQVVVLSPSRPDRLTWEKGEPIFVYRMRARTSSGERIVDQEDPSQVFFVGAQLGFLGREEQLTDPVHYQLEWVEATPPASVPAGSRFAIPVRIVSRSFFPLDSSGAIPVYLSYHWIDRSGRTVVAGGRRSPLAAALAPGAELTQSVEVIAPEVPGRYVLRLDAVREHLGWFSERGGAGHDIDIEVTAAFAPATPAAEPGT